MHTEYMVSEYEILILEKLSVVLVRCMDTSQHLNVWIFTVALSYSTTFKTDWLNSMFDGSGIWLPGYRIELVAKTNYYVCCQLRETYSLKQFSYIIIFQTLYNEMYVLVITLLRLRQSVTMFHMSTYVLSSNLFVGWFTCCEISTHNRLLNIG